MRIKILFFSLLIPVLSQAEPKKLEVIFLAHSYVHILNEALRPQFLFYKKNVAISLEEAKKTCMPMGDGCFHPQFGIIENQTDKKPVEKEKEVQLRTINALETNLVECREEKYFDIFCGKAKAISKPAPIEVWVDISASMKHVDSDVTSKTCYRKSFINNILTQCPKNTVDISVYNNSIKLMDEVDTVCLSYGMNSPKRFQEWINASTAEHLLVVTDIDEMTRELRDFLEMKGAKITGIGAKDFSAKDLNEFSKEFIKTCKKK